MKKCNESLFFSSANYCYLVFVFASVGSSVYKISCQQELWSWDTSKHGVGRHGMVADINAPSVLYQKDTL